jgi:hypothetical protein
MQKIRNWFRSGIKLPFLNLTFAMDVRRSSPNSLQAEGVILRQIHYLLKKYSYLNSFYDASVEQNPSETLRMLNFFNNIIPLFNEDARGSHLRSLLFDLSNEIVTPKLKEIIDREIALSNLKDGVIERTNNLSIDLSLGDELKKQKIEEMKVFETFYEAKEGLLNNIEVWRSLGDVRGNSLVQYFKTIQSKLNGKHILHVAPEDKLQEWFQSLNNIKYETLDAFSDSVSLKEDLTSINIENDYADFIVCHRVLEHILDDQSALNELFRVLKPNGILSISVPQSYNSLNTIEWVVPDKSHDLHVRQYGRDFASKLEAVGFYVEIVYDFLNKTTEEHKRDKTYPMRFFNATKKVSFD